MTPLSDPLPAPGEIPAPTRGGIQVARIFMYLFLFLAMSIFSSLLQKFIGHRQLMAGVSGQLVTLISYGCLVVAAFLAGVQRADTARLLMLWMPMIAFVALSSLWSTAINDTLLKTISWSLLLVGMSLFCAASLQGAFERSLGFLAVLASWGSLIVDQIDPSFTHGFANNMFIGLFVHKGNLADACSLGGLLALYWAMQRRSTFWGMIFVGCLIGVFLSDTWSAVFGLSLGTFILVFRKFVRSIFLGCWALAMLLPLANSFIPKNLIIDLLDRDMTFSGRTYLWDFAFRELEGRWLLGNGFKNVGSTAGWDNFMNTIFLGDQIVANHTHNLWVETLYMGGLVGVACLAVYLIVLPLRSFDTTQPHHLLLMSFLTYFAFISALKMPFFSNSLTSIVALYAISTLVLDKTRARSTHPDRQFRSA
jgi:O-antigen ligase